MSLIFSSIVYNIYQNKFWSNARNLASNEGQRYIDISRRLNPNRLVSRSTAIWETPFDQKIWPGYEMPTYEPNFKMSFEEITNARALEIKTRIIKGEKFALMYSGGIDSTVMLAALIKNLSDAELAFVSIAATSVSILNNPDFWKMFVVGKFKILDAGTCKYDKLIQMGLTPITGDTGDCLYGTTFATHLYYNWKEFAYTNKSVPHVDININIKDFTDPNIHYSKFKDLLVNYFAITKSQGYPFIGLDPVAKDFGEWLYDKLDQHAQTAPMVIYSMHDFFWWYIFNIKYINCAVRGSIYYNDTLSVKQAHDSIVNWYHTTNYQHWAMSNNGNGNKISYSGSSYKKVARDYIYDLDHNDFYRRFKLKIENIGLLFNRQSLVGSRSQQPNARFGVDDQYQLLSIDDPMVQQDIIEQLANFKK